MSQLAQCNDLFLKFDEKIRLKPEKKESLRISRNALRTKIQNYFENTLKVTKPVFWGQGSYMMNTIIEPIDGEFDIDDGVYLKHLSGKKEEDWPATSTVHNWILKAVDGHTSTPPVNKNTCIRVIYKKEYHIDFPIYIKGDNAEHPKLAHKTKGWIDSDPKELTNWFNKEVSEKGDQLKRIVRYFKAWKDNKKGDDKFPSGMIFTILATNHFVDGYEEDDDSAFIAIAKNIYDDLSDSFTLERPVFPKEELIEDWSETAKTNFLSKLSTLITNGQKALEKEKKNEAADTWIKVFGERFPVYSPPENRIDKGYALQTSEPAILGNHGRSS
ncbi:CBASS cGAMP synthase [Schinkia azotoformans]|uniref:CBASS cGAMP synthase n=1 Tax=Schinkia azotoformans TaxID=1454 RepID=UPI002DB6C4C2|nr:CBASS cGAMP synthase [Schinkia azotoformans]MEC1769270.1 CBASS cGAMP synthase [Schinkia azotoformans]MEC1787936.1 CBASS cGAMP synthase [Schinkia azotoformans]MED4377356.1 CBASS cGAMP synthase [Schinkia azotoformans]MED4420193.1 CBASS cGAMP synthase [Schinkia azotoformans]